MAMALKQEELQIIGEYVQSHLTEWLPEHVTNPAEFTFPIELSERMVRVEVELKNQRELMKQGFDQIDRRLDQMQINMDKRFEQVDKRFEQMKVDSDKRFEQVDKRFEQVDKRFEQIIYSIDRLSDNLDKRDNVQRSFTMRMFS
ncbi:MAG: hypothetical protein KAH95_07875, partial [Spirochaetales bacterium]|nr:hypothetical protein [Spirochaetales bacterium]